MRTLFLGNEALAQGAIDAGLSGVYAYPGTPSTEITEYIQKSKLAKELGIHSIWSVNEKTAMEAALGMSYAGKRTLTVMKHVGLNVAADVFMNMSISGVNGGLVVVVADDPSMHSSQNEQDSRFYAKFAMIPVLEPSNQQEMYDLTRYAFDLSEELKLPIMIRTVTRLSHSRAFVNTQDRIVQNDLKLPEDTARFALIPSYARGLYQNLLDIQPKMEAIAENSKHNSLTIGTNNSLGIIACGLGYNYLMENFEDGCPYSVLKVTEYPLPRKKVKELFNTCDQILVLEEGYPLVEEMIGDYFRENTKVIGRLSGHVNRTGELNPNIVAKSLGISETMPQEIPAIVENRPPQLCVGCGHGDVFEALKTLLPEIGTKNIFSDIGCYTLGVLPPHNIINTAVDMGASITMAKGAADAGVFPAFAIIGDSTFTHSGMTGLLDAVYEKSPITVIISDNSASAMTGAQDSAALGRLKDICLGIGVEPEHLKVIIPLSKNHEANVNLLREEMNYKGVSVIIAQRACVQLPKERKEIIKKMNTLS